ncbi:MAG: helix-turn-helix domain-containing protein [Anaerolineales bacterium]|nr:helix-turn-helix domain-containing protein [Anaerolineales bacterium]
MNLILLVINKSRDLGAKEAAHYFGVTETTIYNWWNGKKIPSLIHAQRVLDDKGDDVSDLASWEGRKVLIGHPAYSFVEPATHLTLIAAMRDYGPDKAGYTQVEGTLIDEARNELGRRLIRHETAEAIIMVDHDMVLPCGNADLLNGRFNANMPSEYASKNFISALMSHPPEFGIIGATYVGRNPNGKIQCSSGFESAFEDAKIRNNPKQGLKQVGWVATGAIMIRKWVLQKMSEAAPTKFPEIISKDGPGWFTKAAGMGEDCAFGMRAGQVGIASYVDCSTICGHIGKFTYWPSNTTRK